MKYRPPKKTKLYYSMKTWKKFDVEKQEALTQRYHVILTDHKTWNERIHGIVRSVLRPTPEQRKAQKKKLDRGISKVTNGIGQFDSMMDEFSDGLRKATGGIGADPVEGIMGKRDRTPDLHDAVFGKSTKRRQAF